jgi:N-methylhydantoinase A/oxoprolinase/acetone carboxylase beta subunit
VLTVGIDVGGTFTDVFVRDSRTGRFVVHKVPSTPPHFDRGFMQGLLATVERAGAKAGDVSRVIHGTTVATNCILTQSGARLGLLMTEGLRDVLYIGVGWRPRMYEVDMDPVEPLFLAPRRRSLGVRERLGARGEVVTPLDEAQLAEVARTLVEEHDVQVFVVCFLHSYANPAHERRAREVLAGLYPRIPVTLSSDVLPRKREYRRLVAAGFDGYVKPIVTNYLAALQGSMSAAGVDAPLHIMLSHGGVAGVGNVVERPVRTVLSGLAAGVIGAAHVGATAGCPDCISLDMGGTSTDVALIRGGRALVTNDGKFEDYPLNLTMVDVRTIGAGGSSKASVDAAGGLKVGPESAGANPGPACYGRGGTTPTVTDASFVLGYLTPQTFAGGIDIDVERAHRAIEEQIAKPLGMSVLEAALGIHAIVNSNMAQTLRLVSIKRGHDPRDFTLIPFGGAGPLQGGRLAEAASIRRILIAPAPGVLSALGLLLAPIQHESMATFEAAASAVTAQRLRAAAAPLDADCARRMQLDAVPAGDARVAYFVEMRYIGQAHELEVALGDALDDAVVERAVAEFHRVHEQTYSHSERSAPTEFVTLRAVHTADPAGSSLLAGGQPPGGPAPSPRRRPICLDARRGFEDVDVWSRAELPVGFSFTGPAIVEQADTTTLVYPGHRAAVDALGNILIDVPLPE